MAAYHFNEGWILDQGGQGIVYKGILIDGTISPVKKSKINHRNLVKLLGFCLENEVPLLVHEFVLNGTLYQYLHDPDREFPVLWEMWLIIAKKVVGALSYLHSAAAIPIYHHDIKSSNILLDKNIKQKCQFTDKGNVYGFGVVLVELLTGEKPITQLRAEEGKNLASYFIILTEEK
ncbi:hypothetical protein EUGRSUZ_A02060 [Eucalyptus grandis]|uniref:Protein kinase domain-containing protein n=2 Tax=Eucalyptus grandis TaxID=71139 RepID=A0A059DHC4_EUCGR|nr:hypothetical protein EUGRSUZ_A02060 [Eucalyptus grandis]